MHARYLRLRHARGVVVRPLRSGDVATVAAVFERLGERSRRTRFNGPKPSLSQAELDHLAVVDDTRHVLVAYLDLPSHDEYVKVVSAAAAKLVSEHYLLQPDADAMIKQAEASDVLR